ncbi:S-adenosylmethionine-dependent methyltransferase [Komagataella phaffii CBS 7435]|uniref:S-adenosylmethionine-dependent methyltransferase of the seven beta-strand family n=2 Tax=Komagataella phaffii TaxID=460519 RepID=C4QXS9_KOMPG|nr:Putative S-adenosylmethionine-dependent methyltransferase of the seven beta-strand family [Komagataella phaffii GS115]AOA61362.1 GQ67_01961T0 [Komagataella phaffii]CAH2446869.1 S-adenosylmethionine-dependent methyltransferase [Komagataella phaffii CBS 7435]AOA66701.1 GQ68_01976T0 [Komagataella phaffii GS115]CAY68052.1 Putative S-adenosylmethionine-dependent methyltransferase of the seven beta-strand family [Komagataella phaffii GS115]CCA37127.1 S-adenosylmethionine-dependent methyltransfera
MTGFDVLDFFEPCGRISCLRDELSVTSDKKKVDASTLKENEDAALPDDRTTTIDVLDLPHISLKPPKNVLVAILRILKLEQQCNFGPGVENLTPSQFLSNRDLTIEDISDILPWLTIHSPRIASLDSFCQIGSTFTDSRDIVRYLTTILSSPLNWLQDPDVEDIYKAASSRLSERCGRTSIPDFVRKIVLKNLYERTGCESIQLKEPSLTSDNLGLKTWGSSFILSQRLINDDQRYLKEPIMELGAGTGLIGIVVAHLGYHVTLSDLPEILPNLKENIKLNHASAQADCHELDWTRPDPFIKENPNSLKGYNTLIFSDPVYSTNQPRWVADISEKFLRKSTEAHILLQVPIRSGFQKERDKLWALMEDKGFQLVESHQQDGYDDFGEQKFVFRVYKWYSSYL